MLQGLDASDPIPVDDPETGSAFALDEQEVESTERALSPVPSCSQPTSAQPKVLAAPPKARSRSRPISVPSMEDTNSTEEVDSDVPSRVELVTAVSTLSRPRPRAKSHSSFAKGIDDKVTPATPPPPRKRRKDATGGLVKKRPRVILSDVESEDEEMPVPPPPAQSTAKLQLQPKVSNGEKENEHRSIAAASQKSGHAEPRRPAAKKKRRAKEEKDEDGEVKTTAKKGSSSSLPGKSTATSQLKRDTNIDKSTTKVVELDPASLPLPLSEMQGMLIETLATSRASSMPPSSLYAAMMSSRPALKEYQSCEHEGPMERNEWVRVIEGVLQAGWASSGVFDKVESTVRVCFFHQLLDDVR